MKSSLGATATIIIIALFLVSCGDGNGGVNATSGSAPSTTGVTTFQIVHNDQVLGRTFDDQVSHFSVSFFNDFGTKVYGPAIEPQAASILLENVPVDSKTIGIEYLDQDSAVHTFRTSVKLEEGQHEVLTNPAFVDLGDATVFSFVTFGCNRVQNGDLAKLDDPSSANVGQLLQSFEEIGALSPSPSYLFLTGDVVSNLRADTKVLEGQLTAWKGLLEANLPGDETRVVVLPGNHEMLLKNEQDKELPNPPTGEIFTSVLANYILGDNGPTNVPPNPDEVARDESKLSYTFIEGTYAFICLNTETYVGTDQVGRVPLNWLEDQLKTLEQNSAISDVFVFGHRPVTSDPGAGVTPSQAAAMYALLSNSDKVRGYFCSHLHSWSQSIPSLAPKGSSLHQVVAGNGGSRPDGDAYFGYTIVHLKQSNGVTIQSWGRPVPNPYYSSDPKPPAATLREHLSI
jgi:calcineurin-like phosphoesterase family protein